MPRNDRRETLPRAQIRLLVDQRGDAADGAHLADYAKLAATAEGFARYLDQHVFAKKAA